MKVDILTLTSKGGLLPVLLSECHFCAAFNPAGIPVANHPPFSKFQGIWDTGATNTVITQAVVDACGLVHHTFKNNYTANGPVRAPAYMVNMKLQHGVHFPNLEVTRGELPPGTDALIGMDVITHGDFAITNVGSRTVMSFRVPSVETIDFRQATQPAPQAPRPGFRLWGKKGKKR